MGINEELNVVIFATGDYRFVLEDIVLKSIVFTHPHFSTKNIGCLIHEQEIDLAGETHNLVYKELMRNRIDFYRERVHANKGKKILFLDCDVILIDSCLDEINEILNTCDFAMQQNYIAGIWGVNCNDRTCAFFDNFTRYITDIPPEERQDGYPQFELGDFIEKYSSNNMLDVIELPPEYGFLVPDMKIYHAINGGKTFAAKALTLMLVHQLFWASKEDSSFNMEEKCIPWPSSHETEGGDFFSGRMHNNITWFGCFRESHAEQLENAVITDGVSDWTKAEPWVIPQEEILSVLAEEPIRVYSAASWCDLTQTPRFCNILDQDRWLYWLGYDPEKLREELNNGTG